MKISSMIRSFIMPNHKLTFGVSLWRSIEVADYTNFRICICSWNLSNDMTSRQKITQSSGKSHHCQLSAAFFSQTLFLRSRSAGLILSRVRGSVTNNNGFWIGWLDLLTPSLQSLVITVSYSAIANLPTSQITRTCSILVLRCVPILLTLLFIQTVSLV
jgi:hypothetical protein